MDQEQNKDDRFSSEKWRYLLSIRASEVDHDNAPLLYTEFVRYLDDNCRQPAHYVRYCQTFLAMAPYLDRAPGTVILETGTFSDITHFLRTKGFRCRKTTGDLRYAIDANDSSTDFVFCFEVIEHIKDQTEFEFSEIVLHRGTGVRCFAAEIVRVLRPGGLLVLTTPNPCSARALELLVQHIPPMVFRPHEREYSRDELVAIFAELEPVVSTTHYTFFNLSKEKRAVWKAVFERNEWDTEGRGDDHFLIFRKPPASADRA